MGSFPANDDTLSMETQETGAPAFLSRQDNPPNRRRYNHWLHRNPGDFVSYPKLEPLPYLKESRLIQLAQQGDIAARNEVWLHHVRLVLSVINRFHVPDALLPDAIQEGCMGIRRAIERFHVERFSAFSTCAWWWIYQSIQSFLVAQLFPVRIPSHLFTEYLTLRRDLRNCRQPGDEICVLNCRRESNASLHLRLMQIHAIASSLPIQELHKTLQPTTFDAVEHIEIDWRQICRTTMNCLHRRERGIIEKRYGLTGDAPKTLEEVGLELGVTRERIRQIQNKAELKLHRQFDQIRPLLAWAANDDISTHEHAE